MILKKQKRSNAGEKAGKNTPLLLSSSMLAVNAYYEFMASNLDNTYVGYLLQHIFYYLQDILIRCTTT
jgi:hypothetical protein